MSRPSPLVRLPFAVAGFVLLCTVTTAAATAGGWTITMQGESMAPTLQNGQVLRVDTAAYRHHAPQRADVVVFHAVAAGLPDRYFIKRVVGLPGETVAVHGGTIYINGRRLKERYRHDEAFYAFGPRKVPANAYFVLGDNRNNSYDSHIWLWLHGRDIVGKVLVPSPVPSRRG